MCCPGAWKADSLWLFGVQSPLLHLFLAPPFLLLKYSQWDSAQEMCVGLAERILVRFLPFLGLSFSCHCCLVTKLCLTLCDPMACSMPGFPVLHYLPEFAQTHVHWVGDAIQPSYPLSPPSPPALNLSQHQVFLSFSMIQWMLALWSLVPLPFLKPAWTSGGSWFIYCWSLLEEFWALLC